MSPSRSVATPTVELNETFQRQPHQRDRMTIAFGTGRWHESSRRRAGRQLDQPERRGPGRRRTPVTINGSGFISGVIVLFGGTNATITQDPTQITANCAGGLGSGRRDRLRRSATSAPSPADQVNYARHRRSLVLA